MIGRRHGVESNADRPLGMRAKERMTDLEGGLSSYTGSEDHTCTRSGLSDRLGLHRSYDL